MKRYTYPARSMCEGTNTDNGRVITALFIYASISMADLFATRQPSVPSAVTEKDMAFQGLPASPADEDKSMNKESQAERREGAEMETVGWIGAVGAVTVTLCRGEVYLAGEVELDKSARMVFAAAVEMVERTFSR